MDVLAVSATADRCGYYLVGDGPIKVMVLHGWLSDSASWQPFWPECDTETYTWCFMDARGYGLSRERRGAYSMAEIAHDALAVADSLGWQDLSLVGHSMTGIAIQRALLAAPERVRSLVGVTAVPASGGGLVGERRGIFEQAVLDVDARSAIIARSTGGAWGEADVLALAQRSMTSADAAAVRGYLDSWADGDFHEEVAGRRLPVSVIVGETDPSLTAERMAATWLAWYPASSLEVIAGCGHYPMLEQPGQLARLLEKSLSIELD